MGLWKTRKSWRSYRSGFHCYYCYTVSKNLFLLLCCFYKVFTALKKPILFLRCFYYIAAPAKFLLLLLFQQCWRNSKSDVENLWLWLYIRYIRCKSDVVIHLIGMIICIIQMWKFIWLEYYKCKSEVEIHFIRITKICDITKFEVNLLVMLLVMLVQVCLCLLLYA